MPTFWKSETVWNRKPKAKKSNPEDKCWKAFSEYVRLRDCLRTTGSTDIGRCVTCKQLVENKGNDAGHYVSRWRWRTKYDPKNVHLQCVKCNRFQQGNWIEYREFMLDFYGKEQTENLEILSRALEAKWIDWGEQSETWSIRKKALQSIMIVQWLWENQFQVRQRMESLMREGTLEEFIDSVELSPEFARKRGNAKKDLRNET